MTEAGPNVRFIKLAIPTTPPPPFSSSHTISHIAKLFAEKGSDGWWELPMDSLLPPEVLKKVSSIERHEYGRITSPFSL